MAYGLGDFYTDPEQPNAQQSMILNLTFERDSDGRVSITDTSYIPVFNDIYLEDGVRKFRVLDVYRNLAELKRVDMTSTQAELFNQLLDTIDTMHNYGGEEWDVGPTEKDRRIVQKAIEEGEVSSATIRALKRAEREAAEDAAARQAEQQEYEEYYEETYEEEPDYEEETAPEEVPEYAEDGEATEE